MSVKILIGGSGGGGGTDLLPLNNTWAGTNQFNQNVFIRNAAKIDFEGTDPDDIVLRSLQSGDGNYRVIVRESGEIQWGDGTSNPATDTRLFRNGAGNLKTNGGFSAGGGAVLGDTRLRLTGGSAQIFMDSLSAANKVMFTSNFGGSEAYRIDANGKQSFSDGIAGAYDTFLYRSGVGKLTSEADFLVKKTSDAFPWLEASNTSNRLYFGNGTAQPSAGSAYLHLGSNGNVGCSADFVSEGYNICKVDLVLDSGTSKIYHDTASAATTTMFRSKLTADSQYRYQFDAAGKQQWGPGGAGVPDTNLYRSTGNTLKTDDDFVSGGTIGFGAGTTADAWLQYDSGVGAIKPIGADFFAEGAEVMARTLAVDAGAGTGTALFRVTTNGHIDFYPNAGVTPDTNLYRSTVGTLRTDNSLIVDTNLTVNGNTALGSAITDLIGMYGATAVAQAAAITSATGGVIIDVEARAALNSLLTAVRNLGLIAT